MDRTSVLVKFPTPLLERVEAFAKSEGKNRMAAILALIERGLDRGGEVVAATPSPKTSFSHGRTKTVVIEAARGPDAVSEPMTSREARDAFWRKTGAFNPKGKK